VPLGRRSVRRRLAWWLFGSLAGALVVAVPDDGRRIFSLSATHGPSAGDLLGVAILLAAWLPIVHLLWIARTSIGRRWAMAATLLAAIGLLALVMAVAKGRGSVWIMGAALLIFAHMVAVAGIGRARPSA
jgi:Na+/pantothenate symporter